MSERSSLSLVLERVVWSVSMSGTQRAVQTDADTDGARLGFRHGAVHTPWAYTHALAHTGQFARAVRAYHSIRACTPSTPAGYAVRAQAPPTQSPIVRPEQARTPPARFAAMKAWATHILVQVRAFTGSSSLERMPWQYVPPAHVRSASPGCKPGVHARVCAPSVCHLRPPLLSCALGPTTDIDTDSLHRPDRLLAHSPAHPRAHPGSRIGARKAFWLRWGLAVEDSDELPSAAPTFSGMDLPP